MLIRITVKILNGLNFKGTKTDKESGNWKKLSLNIKAYKPIGSYPFNLYIF